MDATLLDFPEDDNGDVLRRMQRNGDTLTISRDVDFTVVFVIEDAAREFAKVFGERGYRVSVTESGCKPDLPWDVLVVRDIVPTHAGITEFENELQEVAEGLGGLNDGWGCINQKDGFETLLSPSS